MIFDQFLSAISACIDNIILLVTKMGSQAPNITYAVEMEGTKQPGFSSIYRNPQFKNKLTDTPEPHLLNLRDVLVQTCLKKYGTRKALGKIVTKGENKEVEVLTYRQSFDMADRLGKAIIANNLEYKVTDIPDQKMRLFGIYSKNRVEWAIVDMASMLYGLTSVPLYDTLGIENLSYCMNQTMMTSVFVSGETAKTLVKLTDHGNLKNIISFDRLDATLESEIKKSFNLFYYENLMKEDVPKDLNYEQFKIMPNDIYTFSYTSGTTGPPKGAMLSHGNVTALLASFINHSARFNQEDTYLSFLPLPHVFERIVLNTHYYSGSFITFYSGDVQKVKDDCQIVKPTIFVGVPRLYNKIVEGVMDNVNTAGGISACLFNMGLNSKKESMQKNGGYQSGFYDSVVFSKVKQKFGGKIRMLISGSAPLTQNTQMVMKALMSAPLYEGYGQTENTAAAFIQASNDPELGQVGGIVSALQFRLMDLPEMHYTSNDKDEDGLPTPRGEIWLRGPQVFMGYYKNKEKTDEALTKDGWLLTGDVGMLLPHTKGLKLIDRKKNIFKLQQGEYIASEKIENIYSKSPYVDEVFLTGDSTQNFAVAVIVANKKAIEKLGQEKNITGTFEQLCSNKDMKLLVCKELNKFGRSEGLNSLQNAKNIFLDPQTFQQRDVVTNTMKLQRFAAKKVYQSQIETMYKEGELPLK